MYIQIDNPTMHDITLKNRTLIGHLQLVSYVTPLEVKKQDTSEGCENSSPVEVTQKAQVSSTLVNEEAEQKEDCSSGDGVFITELNLQGLSDEQKPIASKMLQEEAESFAAPGEIGNAEEFQMDIHLACTHYNMASGNDLMNNMHEGHQTDILVMGFSKAFDKVSHQRLLSKLVYNGIGGKTNKWIKSFLSGQKQRVLLEGESSNDVGVLSGVPQGSVLGPCLFLFYINDLPESLASNVRLFADDTIVYLTIHSARDTHTLQNDPKSLRTGSGYGAWSSNPTNAKSCGLAESGSLIYTTTSSMVNYCVQRPRRNTWESPYRRI